jgi:hypothetical protein
MSTLIRRAPEGAPDLTALAGSRGYRVDDTEGRVGTVAAVVAGAWGDRPEAIEVRVGLFRPALLIVGAADVVAVDPARRRVLLGTSVDLADAYVP